MLHEIFIEIASDSVLFSVERQTTHDEWWSRLPIYKRFQLIFFWRYEALLFLLLHVRLHVANASKLELSESLCAYLILSSAFIQKKFVSMRSHMDGNLVDFVVKWENVNHKPHSLHKSSSIPQNIETWKRRENSLHKSSK